MRSSKTGESYSGQSWHISNERMVSRTKNSFILLQVFLPHLVLYFISSPLTLLLLFSFSLTSTDRRRSYTACHCSPRLLSKAFLKTDKFALPYTQRCRSSTSKVKLNVRTFSYCSLLIVLLLLLFELFSTRFVSHLPHNTRNKNSSAIIFLSKIYRLNSHFKIYSKIFFKIYKIRLVEN